MQYIDKLPSDTEFMQIESVGVVIRDYKTGESYLLTLRDFQDIEAPLYSPKTMLNNYMTVRPNAELFDFCNRYVPNGQQLYMKPPVEAHFECNKIEYTKL